MTDKQREFLRAVADCETAGKTGDSLWLFFAKRCAGLRIDTDHDEFAALWSWARRMGYFYPQPVASVSLLLKGQKALKRESAKLKA